jgi:NAD(P)H-hydrate epimerase
MIAGLLAQGLEPELAAVCGLHIGGACADSFAGTRSGRSMLATDLIRELPVVLAERFEHTG